MADALKTENSAPGAYISERHRNPAALLAQQSHTNYTTAGICAIIATVLFGVLVFLLWQDWSAIRAA